MVVGLLSVSPDLANVSRDKFCHLEHINLTLAVENRLERSVRIDLSSFFLVLKIVLLDVAPQLLREFRSGKGIRADNSGQLIVGLNWFHEGGIWLAFR